MGAWHVVENHQDALRKTVLLVNLEHVATVGPSLWSDAYVETPHLIWDTHGHPFLLEALREASSRFGMPIDFSRTSQCYQGDRYPYTILGSTGLPTLMLMQPFHWYHTIEDDRDKVTPRSLEKATRVHAFLVDRVEAASVAEIRSGWTSRARGRIPPLFNVLDLDLDALGSLELIE